MERIMDTITELSMSLIVDGFIILAVCFIIGELIKGTKIKFLTKINNNKIPLLSLIIGICLSFIPGMFPNDIIIIAAIKGGIIGWASTGAYESYRNFKNKKDCDDKVDV